jgi:hypothetical protein
MPIKTVSEASDLGTEVHRALQGMVERDTWDFDALSPGAQPLVAAGFKVWQKLRDCFTDPVCEQPLECQGVTSEGTEWTLTTDGLDVWSDIGQGLDWKSGFADSDYREQMLGYCAMMLTLNRDLPEASMTVVWLRTGEIEAYRMTRAQLGPWLERLNAAVDWNGTYVAGDHCHFCSRTHECPARAAMVKRDVAPFLLDGDGYVDVSIEQLNSPQKVELLRKATAVAALAGDVRDAIKSYVRLHGPIEGETHVVSLETTEKRNLDTLKAWPVLEQLDFDDETTAGIVSIRLSALEDAVAKAAPKRGGAKAIRELRAKLDEAGAVTLIPEHRLTVRRK